MASLKQFDRWAGISMQTADTRKASAERAPTAALAAGPLPAARAGLIAGLGFGAAMLAVELLTGIPSLPSLLQDRLITLLPGAVSSNIIDRLQFWAKPLALVAIVA